jgi:hypothetical protein
MRRFGFCVSPKLAFVASTLSVAALSAMPATFAHANTVTREGSTIAYSGSVLMRMRTNAGGYAPEQRADEVIERLRPILELPGLRSEDIRVERDPMNGEAMIFVRDLPLVTVDYELARANNTATPFALAQEWASRLRSILPEVSTRQ